MFPGTCWIYVMKNEGSSEAKGSQTWWNEKNMWWVFFFLDELKLIILEWTNEYWQLEKVSGAARPFTAGGDNSPESTAFCHHLKSFHVLTCTLYSVTSLLHRFEIFWSELCRCALPSTSSVLNSVTPFPQQGATELFTRSGGVKRSQ